MKTLRGVMTAAYACEMWGKNDSTTLRQGLRLQFGKYGELVEGEDYIKCGKDWLITEEAMEKLYGKIE